jgi:phage shock protein E
VSSPIEIIEIDAEKLKRMLALHVAFYLVDLRSPEEYSSGHIKGALNIPADEFLTKIEKTVPAKDTPVVVYDTDGEGSARLVLEAEKMGYVNIVNLEKGYVGYLNA